MSCGATAVPRISDVINLITHHEQISAFSHWDLVISYKLHFYKFRSVDHTPSLSLLDHLYTCFVIIYNRGPVVKILLNIPEVIGFKQ